MQSKRVMATISMMVGTPRPSSPTIQARAPRYSISLEAFDQLPSLSFQALDVELVAAAVRPVRRGSRKQVRPLSV